MSENLLRKVRHIFGVVTSRLFSKLRKGETSELKDYLNHDLKHRDFSKYLVHKDCVNAGIREWSNVHNGDGYEETH